MIFSCQSVYLGNLVTSLSHRSVLLWAGTLKVRKLEWRSADGVSARKPFHILLVVTHTYAYRK